MRWALVVAKSFASGLFAIVLAIVGLLVALHLYSRYVLHLGPNEQVGWDPVSLFGQHFKFVLLSIPVLIFLLGFGAGFLFFSRSVRWPRCANRIAVLRSVNVNACLQQFVSVIAAHGADQCVLARKRSPLGRSQ